MGPGIYGGVVRRDAAGEVVTGEQYQGHNPRPGPVYAGGGYTPVNSALRDLARLGELLDQWPDLVNDVSTGQKTIGALIKQNSLKCAKVSFYHQPLVLLNYLPRRSPAAAHGRHEPR